MPPASVPHAALWRRFPAVAELIPLLPLGDYPTPLEPLPRELAGAGAWIKRDDLTAQPYGGNKIRKLEVLLADARRRGAKRLITAGAFGSHHCLATTIHGRRAGFDVTCLLFPQSVTGHVREVLAGIAAAGAQIRFVPRMEAVPLVLTACRALYALDAPYLVAPGGSDALGTLGYASAALELSEQLASQGVPAPAEIHVAAGTLGTAAGIALGLQLAGVRDTRVVAVRITSKLVTNERVLARLVRGACSRLRRAGVALPNEKDVLARIRIEHGEVGAGYGKETARGQDATERFAALGLYLDPTYTAKAAASFLASGAQPRVFWHTLSARSAPAPDDALRTLPHAFLRRLV